MTGALGYLTLTTARNRFRVRLKRLREPRYALALLLGGTYVWFFLLRPQPSSREATDVLLGVGAEIMSTLFITLVMISSWITSSGKYALAYTPAEIHFLFPGPLTRRTLLGYKLLRAQLVLALNALLWVFILRRGGSELHGFFRAISVWIVFTTLMLHRMGAALARVSWTEHGRAGVMRHRLTLLVLAAFGAAIGWAVVPALIASSRGEGLGFSGFVGALQTAPTAWALAPVRWLLRPTFAQSVREWLTLIAPALAVLAAHALWVFRADVAFEEAAVRASAERAEYVKAIRDRSGARAVKSRRAKRTLPLPAVGIPLGAIVWKNTLALWRTTRPAGLLLVIWISFPVALAASKFGDGEGGARRFIGVMAATAVAGLAVMGSRIVRNDLRQDMLHLEQLKTLPLRGRSIVAAEIASSALGLTVLQVSLLLIAYVLLLHDPWIPLSPGDRTLIVLGALPALALFNATSLAIQNGVAVLFPAWTRLGPVTGGIEVLGQGLIALIGALLAVLIVLVPPAIFVVAGLEIAMGAGAAGIALLSLGGAAVLALELYALIVWLGRAFERTEPSHVV